LHEALIEDVLLYGESAMERENIQRNSTIDTIKAIGIISIIIGHSVTRLPITHINIGQFVYLFHITIFFFVAGFTYSEKYDNNLPLFFGRRFMGVYPKYICYNTLFVFLHNTLSRLSLISAAPYTFSDLMIWLSAGFAMHTNETMLGAFWFLPVLVVSCVLFALARSASVHVSFIIKKRMSFHISMIVFIALYSAAGLYFNYMGRYLTYHIQTSFLAAPFIYIGFLVKQQYNRYIKYFCRLGYLISAALLYFVVAVFGFQIELSVNCIISPLLFYPVSLLGIYFCMALATTIQHHPRISKVMAYIGKNSFHYMALHFIMFKLVDLISVELFRSSPEVLSVFPHSYEYGLLYVLASLAMITPILLIYEKAKKRFMAMNQ